LDATNKEGFAIMAPEDQPAGWIYEGPSEHVIPEKAKEETKEEDKD
jgi:hypothetical protein